MRQHYDRNVLAIFASCAPGQAAGVVFCSLKSLLEPDKFEYMLVSLRSRRTEIALSAAPAVLCGAVWLLGFAHSAAARSGEGQGGGSSGSFAGAEFAIGDFDGDRIPDLATVEANPNSAWGDSHYSIRLQLTSGAAQVFGVTAPAGGLQIVAQDLNGDNALDVLVRTPWQHKAVAVLLNDGHGNFTLTDPGAFPGSIQDRGTRWSFGTIAYSESGVLVRTENSQGDFAIRSVIESSRARESLASRRDSPHVTGFLIFSDLDRGPPGIAAQT